MIPDRFEFNLDLEIAKLNLPTANSANPANQEKLVSGVSKISNGSSQPEIDSPLPLCPKDQAVLNVKMAFPGAMVLTEAEAKALLPKLKPAEWEEIDSDKKEEHE